MAIGMLIGGLFYVDGCNNRTVSKTNHDETFLKDATALYAKPEKLTPFPPGAAESLVSFIRLLGRSSLPPVFGVFQHVLELPRHGRETAKWVQRALRVPNRVSVRPRCTWLAHSGQSRILLD